MNHTKHATKQHTAHSHIVPHPIPRPIQTLAPRTPPRRRPWAIKTETLGNITNYPPSMPQQPANHKKKHTKHHTTHSHIAQHQISTSNSNPSSPNTTANNQNLAPRPTNRHNRNNKEGEDRYGSDDSPGCPAAGVAIANITTKRQVVAIDSPLPRTKKNRCGCRLFSAIEREQ